MDRMALWNKNRVKKNKRKKSLTKAIRRLSLIIALTVFLAAGAINWAVSQIEFIGFIGMGAQGLAQLSYKLICHADGVEEISKETMAIFRSLSEEERSGNVGDEAYRAHFDVIRNSEEYHRLADAYREAEIGGVVDSVYLAMYDRESSCVVYIADPFCDLNPENSCLGRWEKVTREELDNLLSLDDHSAALNEESGEAQTEEGEEGVKNAYTYIGTGEGVGTAITAGRPMRDADGKIYAFVLVDIPLMLATVVVTIIIVIYLIVLAVITIIVLAIGRIYATRRIVRPIRQISEAASKYADDRMNGDTTVTDHFEKLNIRTRDELEDLSHVMADMEKHLNQYEKDLMKVTAERERIQTELSLAANIQGSMLPSAFSAFSGRNEFDIFAAMDPAKEVGGDFYDFFLIDEDHLALIIADVSGKGVPAALFMMSSKIILSDFATMGLSPKEILQKTNEKICSFNPYDMFVTVWLGILDLKTGTVTAGNAGHEYPVIRHPDGKYELFHDRHCLVLGAMDGVKYSEYTFTLEKDSVLFLYTDGVPEATAANGELYGTERLIDNLNRTTTSDPAQILAAVRADVDAFVAGEPQFDDLTMLCVHYKG